MLSENPGQTKKYRSASWTRCSPSHQQLIARGVVESCHSEELRSRLSTHWWVRWLYYCYGICLLYYHRKVSCSHLPALKVLRRLKTCLRVRKWPVVQAITLLGIVFLGLISRQKYFVVHKLLLCPMLVKRDLKKVLLWHAFDRCQIWIASRARCCLAWPFLFDHIHLAICAGRGTQTNSISTRLCTYINCSSSTTTSGKAHTISMHCMTIRTHRHSHRLLVKLVMIYVIIKATWQSASLPIHDRPYSVWSICSVAQGTLKGFWCPPMLTMIGQVPPSTVEPLLHSPHLHQESWSFCFIDEVTICGAPMLYERAHAHNLC